ncbi:MAG: hypothetical protein R3D98_00220 [Candidatus Krumholzibacteriia bacterium]
MADEPNRDARHHAQQLRRYYRKVVGALRGADEIYICGPGEARTELRKVIEALPNGAARIRAVQPADKMTERQFTSPTRGRSTSSRVRERGGPGLMHRCGCGRRR